MRDAFARAYLPRNVDKEIFATAFSNLGSVDRNYLARRSENWKIFSRLAHLEEKKAIPVIDV